MREGKRKRKKKKSQVLPTSSIQTGFRKKKGKKKILGKEPVFKEHDLCRAQTARSVLFSEETPKHGTRGHRFALSQTLAACVAMVTTKPVSVRFLRSGYA